ncbi:MAG: hypothetical protein LKG27_06880 [Clostridiaceae bacterium]|nr:hypothetical protein [Clostridiaceae bacterium]
MTNSDAFILTSKKKRSTRKMTKLLECLVARVLKNEEIIGSGQSGSVYRINKAYALKFPHNSEFEKDNVLILPDLEKYNDLKTYYGSKVAMLGDASIMRNADPNGKAVPAGLVNKIPDTEERLTFYRDKVLKSFANLPQGAYDDVAHDFNRLNKVGKYCFDTINPNNFLADENKIKIVDDLMNIPENARNRNNMSVMIRALISKYTPDSVAEYDVFATGYRRNILKKIVKASEKYDLPYMSDIRDMDDLDVALKLCDMSETSQSFVPHLAAIRRRFPDEKLRMQEIDKYFENMTNSYFDMY